ncbi:Vps53-like protein [Coprinopsis sp. MPI-PUGE-AT-0042]|nr:Vps53-like protein [Coprinopsis sp. MPI-PUGE-AT-0042]
MAREDLPQEVVLAIQRILDIQATDDSDPFDGLSEEFSTASILNQFFPDEAALGKLDEVNAQLAETQKELQAEVDSLQAELRRNQDPDRMSVIQEMISDLLGQMSRIREKATESEAVVRNITKDIQVLDLAKKNLILSMTTLKRLQMLVNALTQLEDLIQEKKYGEVAQTLSAVKQLSASFRNFTGVPRIARLWKRINDVQGQLRNQLEEDFDAFFIQDTSKPIKPALIAEACQVVDVLGIEVRSHIVDRFVALEMKEYRKIFRTNDEAGQLDNLTRRYAWFRRLIQTFEIEQGRVFPSDWKVNWHLLAKFAEITRDHVTTLLTKIGPSLTVQALLENIQITNEFETSMAKKWATSFQSMLKATDTALSQPGKTIVSAFEPHMNIFVDAQDKALADMLAPHRKGKAQAHRATPRTSLDTSAEEDKESEIMMVFPSSTELFYFYGQSLEQCANLSTGQPLHDLAEVHKKWLRIYAEEVLAISPKKLPSQSRKSLETRVDTELLKQSCLVVNTADYCQTTASELEEKIKEKIDADFKDKISFQAERDLFVSTISAAIGVQLREFEMTCDAPFTTLGRTSWSTVNQVSGPSPYTDEFVKAAEQVVDLIKPLVEQKKYLRNFYDKACSLVLVKFTNSIVRSKPLKEIGAEQLLIDLQTLKAYLTRMPGEASTGYTRALTKTTSRLDALLKVIVTPVDPPEGFVLNYTLLIGDASFSNFQKILDLKGAPKNSQKTLFDSFDVITSTKTDLESASFLSSLDMDPPSTAQIGGSLLSPGGSRLAGGGAVEGIFATLGSVPPSGPSTGTNTPDPTGRPGDRQVLSDLRRFVSFGLRRDSTAPS